MKHMKKILLVAALLTAMTARAQMTPEAIMGSVPTMPSTAEMLQYYSDYTNPNGEGVPDPNVISNFLEAWEEARRNIDANNKTGDVIQRRVMNSKVGNGTNKSVKEVENMSDAEAEAMAKATMNKQLAGYGISQKDLARMQSGQMSEAEMAALASKMMEKQTGGLNMRDIQAMENMTDEERMDYMQQTGLAESTSKKMQENKPKQAAQKHRAELTLEGQKLDQQMYALMQEINGMKTNALDEGRALYSRKYKARNDELEEQAMQAIRDGAGWEKYDDKDRPRVEAASKRLQGIRKAQHKLMCEYMGEFIPMWRDAVTNGMDKCRSQMMPLARQREKIGKELYDINKEAEYAQYDMYPFTAASFYFELSRDVVEFEQVLKDPEE